MITTVVGNYPKVPSLSNGPNLRTAIGRFDQGRITAEELAAVADEATADAIAEQVEAGVDLVTDGHIRWQDEITYFAGGLTGVTLNGLLRWFDSNTYFRQPYIEEALAWEQPVSVRDLKFAVEHSSKPLKVVLPGLVSLTDHVQDKHYSDQKRLATEFARSLNAEAKALQEAGATFIQFNDPVLTRKHELLPLLQENVDALLDGITVKTALYTYFGDVIGIEDGLFSLPFQVYGLDFVTNPASVAAFKSFPMAKELGVGLLDARNTKLEDTESVVGQIKQLAQVAPLDHMYLNPSCGLEFLPRQNAYDKLVRLVEVGQRAMEVV